MSQSFPSFKHWNARDVDRLFRQHDSIRDKNRARYMGVDDQYYSNTVRFQPLLDRLKPVNRRLKKIKDLSKTLDETTKQALAQLSKGVKVDAVASMIKKIQSSGDDNSANELKDMLLGGDPDAYQAYAEYYPSAPPASPILSRQPTPTIPPRLIRRPRTAPPIPPILPGEDYSGSFEDVRRAYEAKIQKEDPSFFELLVDNVEDGNLDHTILSILSNDMYSGDFENMVRLYESMLEREDPEFLALLQSGQPPSVAKFEPWYNLEDVGHLEEFPVAEQQPQLPQGGPPSREELRSKRKSKLGLRRKTKLLTPQTPEESIFSNPSIEEPTTPSTIDPLHEKIDKSVLYMLKSGMVKDIANTIYKMNVDDLMSDNILREELLYVVDTIGKIKALFPISIFNEIFEHFKNGPEYPIVDLVAFQDTTDDILNLLIGNNGLPLDQNVNNAFHDMGTVGFPSASLVLRNNRWEIFGKPVSFPDPLHINIGGELYLLTPMFLRLLITSNPYILNNMVDNIDKLKFMKIVAEQLSDDPDDVSLQKINIIQSTITKKEPEGSGYKTQMAYKKKLVALHKRSSKRRAVKSAKTKAKASKVAQDLAPLIDEIRKIEGQIHDTTRFIKGKPEKVRDGTARLSKKTGRIKKYKGTTKGTGAFSNTDAFGSSSRRKSVRVQAEKQIKTGATFGSGLPSLKSKLMLLKGSQMAGNKGKRVKAEIQKIEKKLN